MPRRGGGDCSECGSTGPASNGGHVSGCTFEPSPRNTPADVRPRGKKGGASRNRNPKRGRDPKGKFLPEGDAFDDKSWKPTPAKSMPYTHTTGAPCFICGQKKRHTHPGGTAGGD